MRRMIRPLSLLIVFISIILVSASSRAERLEVSLALSPLYVPDSAYRAFSEEDAYALRGGLDIRSEIVNLAGFRLVPFVGYRLALDEGEPYSVVDTELAVHDFLGGLRIRKGLLSWLGVVVDLFGGVVYAEMEGVLSDRYGELDEGDILVQRKYEDNALSWSAGALAGIELQISKSWLRSRGIQRFGFGGDLTAGYTMRGEMNFEPELQVNDDNRIDIATLPWGRLDLSGINIQVSVSARFF